MKLINVLELISDESMNAVEKFMQYEFRNEYYRIMAAEWALDSEDPDALKFNDMSEGEKTAYAYDKAIRSALSFLDRPEQEYFHFYNCWDRLPEELCERYENYRKSVSEVLIYVMDDLITSSDYEHSDTLQEITEAVENDWLAHRNEGVTEDMVNRIAAGIIRNGAECPVLNEPVLDVYEPVKKGRSL